AHAHRRTRLRDPDSPSALGASDARSARLLSPVRTALGGADSGLLGTPHSRLVWVAAGSSTPGVPRCHPSTARLGVAGMGPRWLRLLCSPQRYPRRSRLQVGDVVRCNRSLLPISMVRA